jgi:hypothetical protein
MHGFPPTIAMTAPAPKGAGEEREARVGWGYKCLRQVETGEGGFSPLPVSPSPKGDIPTKAVD